VAFESTSSYERALAHDDTVAASPRVLNLASRETDYVEIRRFVRRRLLVFTRLMAGLFGGLYAASVIAVSITAPAQLLKMLLDPGKQVHLFIILAMLSFLWLLRRSPPGQLMLQICDIGPVLLAAAASSVAVSLLPHGYHLEFVALVIIILMLVLRAAVVPSTGRWTAVVGILCSVPVGIAIYRQARYGPWPTVVPPIVLAFGIGIWCVIATATTSIVSRVIYGLVTQVQKTMHLGQYRLGDKIGEGGMGAVYRAEHAMLRRPTAIKLLLPGRITPEALARFEREVQLTSRLSHPNTIAVYDYGRTPDGVFYYAMEYLEGLTLEQLVLAYGPQPDGRVARVLTQMAGALAEAHGIGLIHRDIKPANVMLCERGGMPDVVKVLDFGLVKKIDGGDAEVALTDANVITGTPLYLAPESITQPDHIDERIDIYALGAVGYFMVTGTPPFSGRTLIEICGHHLHTEPESPSRRLGRPVSEKLETLLLRCLAKDPDRRPRDAREVLWILSDCEASVAPFGPAEARLWWASRTRSVQVASSSRPEPKNVVRA